MIVTASGLGSLAARRPRRHTGEVRVEAQAGSEYDPQQSRQFAVLLNHLFATRLTPEGRPYTLTEVAKATGMSVPYLSMLRKGSIGAISLQRAAALAQFFRVSLDYFSQAGPPADTTDELVRDALAKPLVREVALRAGKVGTVQRALILQMLEHADRVAQELAHASEPPSAEESRPPQADAAASQES
jgi:transcriptional regulator with XRE-family HTH domain